jgi:hypothetical protein
MPRNIGASPRNAGVSPRGGHAYYLKSVSVCWHYFWTLAGLEQSGAAIFVMVKNWARSTGANCLRVAVRYSKM